MSDTLTTSAGRVSATRTVLSRAAYHRLAAAKGAHTDEERRKLAGLSRSTEWRWLHGVTAPSGLRDEVARRLDAKPADKLFVEVAA